jgi:PiT family inorganic phosphate transporter
VSAALCSLGHGGNDASKTMGVIAVLLYANGMLGQDFYVPLWVVLACHVVKGLGTLSGGCRIVRTLGAPHHQAQPLGGFCAECGGAATLFLATDLGIPVSSTHTITGAIVGVESVMNASAVQWGVAGRIVWAWVLIIRCSAFIADLSWAVFH